MAVGGPLMAQNEKDQVISVSPLAFVTAVEARSSSFGGVGDQNQTLSTWWGLPAGGKTAYAIIGHFT